MASDNLNYWSCRSHTQTRTHSTGLSPLVSLHWSLAAYHQLMLHTDTNEENLSGFLKLLDTALQHEVRMGAGQLLCYYCTSYYIKGHCV
jgi:hypothetical protein